MSIIKYKNYLTITLDSDNNYVENIECSLPKLGEGNDRLVYLLPDGKVLKVAKTMRASCINYEEVTLYENIKDKECVIQFPQIYEYEQDWGFYYVCERITMSSEAMEEATRLIPVLDQADNAGYNSKGQLTIVDADMINYTWFVKETNPYVDKI
jgi:hypothetical protein